MGLLFRKRLRLGTFLSLNLSKSGLGLSVGPPGAKLSVNPKRARVQLGILGTGIGYRKELSLPQQDVPTTPAQPHHAWRWLLWSLLALLLLVWLAGCGFADWREQMMRDVMAGRLQVDPSQVGPSGQPSQTIEFYDASGRHTGYGRVQGGTVDLFNADSSRRGVWRGR